MDLTNMQVSHKKFGIGTIEEHDFGIITVKFEKETKKFQYPLAFEGFLELMDATLSKELEQEVQSKKQEIMHEEMKKTAERIIEIAEKDSSSTSKKSREPRPVRDANRSKDILSIHQTCFDFLINYQKEHKDFYFVPRKVNNNDRLDDGYLFIGNDNYLMITFWNGGDRKEKIHNLNFGITENGDCFLEISSRDSEKKADHLRKLVGILEEQNHYKFDEVKVNKWRLDYSGSLSYLNVLESFIDNEKVAIDEYIRMNKDADIGMANQEMHDKYVKRILSKQNAMLHQ
jgi:hypothetical protein